MRPDFIPKEQFRAWLKFSQINKVAIFDGVLASSYVARMARAGRPIRSRSGLYRLIDIYARAKAEGHKVAAAPNGEHEKGSLSEQCDKLRTEVALLEQRKSELSLEVSSAETLSKLRGNAAGLSGHTLLTEAEIVEQCSPLSDCCGVYFLLQGNKVVYVGQSVNVHSRITGHMSSKEFDRFAYVKCDKAALDVLESLYIHALRPPLNGEQNGVPSAPLRLDRLLKLTTTSRHASN